MLIKVFQIKQSTEFSYIPQKEDAKMKLNKRIILKTSNKGKAYIFCLFFSSLIFNSILFISIYNWFLVILFLLNRDNIFYNTQFCSNKKYFIEIILLMI